MESKMEGYSKLLVFFRELRISYKSNRGRSSERKRHCSTIIRFNYFLRQGLKFVKGGLKVIM